MTHTRSLYMITLAAGTLACAAVAQTGNPLADGWVSGGHSMQNGVYARGAGLFSYDVFAQQLMVTSGSAFESSDGAFSWLVGDEIVGIGGVFVAAPSATDNGWASYTTSVGNNDNVTSSLRMVSKFGVAENSWSPSTVAPASGNGSTSHSSGHGGTGSIIIGNTAADVPNFASGALRLPTVAQIYTGSGVANIDARFGRMQYIHSNGIVSSWQAYLNVSLIERELGGSYADLPAWGDRHSVATQRGTNSTLLHDALVVPTPGTAALLGLGGLIACRRRRG